MINKRVERTFRLPEYILSINLAEFIEPIEYSMDFILWKEEDLCLIKKISDVIHLTYKSLENNRLNDVNTEYVENFISNIIKGNVNFVDILNIQDDVIFTPDTGHINEYLYNNILADIKLFSDVQKVIQCRVKSILFNLLSIKNMTIKKFCVIAKDVIKNIFYVENSLKVIKISTSTNAYNCATLEYLVKKNRFIDYDLEINSSNGLYDIHYIMSNYHYDVISECSNIIMYMDVSIYQELLDNYEDDFEKLIENHLFLKESNLSKIYFLNNLNPYKIETIEDEKNSIK
ncbi:hypothetical protein AS589_03230 [Empedobacter brevis]|uniref:hypothetical protein n=1 Tax=Empedobacter brevis TaxID=247 RepID=UPI00131FEF7A|nr:hypothetical protein [Empedobacter brevis]QHC83872.1 hypothetical protein AS589_03230 [Empedobacter brevis]